jgi:hypothetical protein
LQVDRIDFGDQIAALLDSESLRWRLGVNRKRIESGLNRSVDKQILWMVYETALGGA